MQTFLSVLFILLIPFSLFSQGINLDESFNDWESVDTLYFDDDNDVTDGINFSVLKITNDNRYIYFYLEVGKEINLQDLNDITLFIDTDNNSSTGLQNHGIGYDFEFTFGSRSGSVYLNGTESVSAYDVGLVSSPTVTSTVFEFKLDLEARFNNNLLFSSQRISLAFSGGDDQLPEVDQILSYDFSSADYQTSSFKLHKDISVTRVLSYNVLSDNLFESSLENNFKRIFQAIKPDIISLQEVYNNSGAQAAELIESFLPSSENEHWYSGDTGNDNLIVSRYPVIQQTSIKGNAAYLLEFTQGEMLVIVAHPPCCTNNSGRQDEFDAIMAFIRDSKEGLEFDLEENTPLLITGDMNLVGFAQQQQTLLTGDIVNEESYGSDFTPDWDGMSLVDAIPANPNLPTTFTWYSDGSSFSPGRLDYIVYTGSQLDLVNSFSLFTPALPQDTLEAYGLMLEDVTQASDHLPLVADFITKTDVSSEPVPETPDAVQLLQNYPNPFNPVTFIGFNLSESRVITLTIHNINGQKISTVVNNKFYSSGTHRVRFNAEKLSSGVYFYQVESEAQVLTKKMLLIK